MMVEMVSALVDCPMGPGFESQVPQRLCIILFQFIPCSIPGVVHHASSPDHLPDGLQAKSNGLD